MQQPLQGKYKFDYIKANKGNASVLNENLMSNLLGGMRVRASQNAIRLARSNLDYLRQQKKEILCRWLLMVFVTVS